MLAAFSPFVSGFCAGHRIHNDVTTYMVNGELGVVTVKLRGIATHLRISTLGGKHFRTIQLRQNVEGKPVRKPPGGNKTRWTSSLIQVKWANENRPNLQSYHADIPPGCCNNPDGMTADKCILDVDEWGILHLMKKILEPFAEKLTELQGAKYPTANLLMPFLSLLFAHLKKDFDMKDIPSQRARNAAKTALAKLLEDLRNSFNNLPLRKNRCIRLGRDLF
eukprot:GHVU01101267.1.p2 GENE.GHVU01101267.1~~GHVU01101267.1.p2  ORF type:complete len:221 (+),score=11.83 GHVU01101267.1:1206-1868(+)